MAKGKQQDADFFGKGKLFPLANLYALYLLVTLKK